MGGVFGIVYGLLPDGLRGAVVGPVYGLLVWLGFDAVVAPALGLTERDWPKGRERAVFVADHLLFGFILNEMRHDHANETSACACGWRASSRASASGRTCTGWPSSSGSTGSCATTRAAR